MVSHKFIKPSKTIPKISQKKKKKFEEEEEETEGTETHRSTMIWDIWQR